MSEMPLAVQHDKNCELLPVSVRCMCAERALESYRGRIRDADDKVRDLVEQRDRAVAVVALLREALIMRNKGPQWDENAVLTVSLLECEAAAERALDSAPLAEAAARVIECATQETLAERAPVGALPRETVVWDCAQHRRAAVDELIALRSKP